MGANAAGVLDALGDGTRRSVLELLAGGPRAVGEIAGELPVSRPAVSQPPHRFVVTWQITPQFRPEPDPARASEVEVTFVAEAADRTRVTLEHRHFERHGPGFEDMRAAVDSPNGWPGTLAGFAAAIERERPGR